MVAGFFADYMREGRSAVRQRQALRAAFERETLVTLQDWIAKLARAATAIGHQDEMEFRRSGRWGHQQVGPDLNEGFQAAITNVQRLRVRLLDDQLRDEVNVLALKAVEIVTSTAHAESDEAARERAAVARQSLQESFTQLNETIGRLLRESS